jgi:hypothetical protein
MRHRWLAPAGICLGIIAMIVGLMLWSTSTRRLSLTPVDCSSLHGCEDVEARMWTTNRAATTTGITLLISGGVVTAVSARAVRRPGNVNATQSIGQESR